MIRSCKHINADIFELISDIFTNNINAKIFVEDMSFFYDIYNKYGVPINERTHIPRLSDNDNLYLIRKKQNDMYYDAFFSSSVNGYLELVYISKNREHDHSMEYWSFKTFDYVIYDEIFVISSSSKETIVDKVKIGYKNYRQLFKEINDCLSKSTEGQVYISPKILYNIDKDGFEQYVFSTNTNIIEVNGYNPIYKWYELKELQNPSNKNLAVAAFFDGRLVEYHSNDNNINYVYSEHGLEFITRISMDN